jgi:hypothetical protein
MNQHKSPTTSLHSKESIEQHVQQENKWMTYIKIEDPPLILLSVKVD